MAFRCINPICPAQLKRRLAHFSCRNALDIEGMGEAAIEQLIAKGLIRNFADIYHLKKNDLLTLELFKTKKADNLLVAIEKSKKQPLRRLIFALGIRHVGEKVAYVLAQRFLAMDALMKARQEDLEAIYEIGTVMARSIVEFFKQPGTQKLISALRHAGLNFVEKSSKARKTKLNGKAVVFTGELAGLSRTQAESIVRDCGGNASSSVSNSTDFVVVGENPGTKYSKAKKLGVKILSEKEFVEMTK